MPPAGFTVTSLAAIYQISSSLKNEKFIKRIGMSKVASAQLVVGN